VISSQLSLGGDLDRESRRLRNPQTIHRHHREHGGQTPAGPEFYMTRIINRARNSSIAIVAVGRGAHNLDARPPRLQKFCQG
jgi:hypothetical protein